MARAWRIEYEGALYHVLSRGNQGQNIFVDDKDRRLFLKTVAEMSERFEIDIFAFVLMDNHYHLMLRTNQANLSKSMQWFGATYTKRFNVGHSRTGHLFQGRFKNMLVQNDAYMLQLSYYIHRNPIRAGMSKRLSDCRWSSYKDYAYGRKLHRWLNTEVLLSQFINVPDKHKAYREYAQKYSKEEQRIWEDLRHGMFVGTDRFVEQIKIRYLTNKPHEEIPHQKRVIKDIDPEALIVQTAKKLKADLIRYQKSSRISKEDKVDRDLLIYLIWQSGVATNRQIGEKFGLTYSAVSRRVGIFKEMLRKDRAVQKRYNRIKSQIKI